MAQLRWCLQEDYFSLPVPPSLLPKPIMDFCANNSISWKFVQSEPHWRSLGVCHKSMKTHFKVVGETKLTLKSWQPSYARLRYKQSPLVQHFQARRHGMKIITPGHFLLANPWKHCQTKTARTQDITAEALEFMPSLSPKLLDPMV